MLALFRMKLVNSTLPFALACHPHSTPGKVEDILGSVEVRPESSLKLLFMLKSDLAALRIPSPTEPRSADGLWQHTCFEAFVMGAGGPQYREFNFSPSGEWAVYSFQNYRDGMDIEIMGAPRIDLRRTSNRLELEVQIKWTLLPQGDPLRLGLSAVIEDAEGALSYWALRHPPGNPDFHHPDGFSLKLGST